MSITPHITTEYSIDNACRILWQPVGNGIRILKYYGNSPCIRIPESIKGSPVTEIGPYCFSSREPAIPENPHEYLSSLEALHLVHPVNGDFLKEIHLPDSVHTLLNAAFYNCRNLESIYMGTGMKAIGSDEFMNCRNLKYIVIDHNSSAVSEPSSSFIPHSQKNGYDHPTGLPLVLERIDSSIFVIFQTNGITDASILFPEYYEVLDEISPAHIFSRSIEGEGFRMRKCFQDNILDFARYDSCFHNAKTTENAATLCRIALLRLQWPVHLSSSARASYEDMISSNPSLVFSLCISERNLSLMTYLKNFFTTQSEYILDAIADCVAADWSEGSAILIDSHDNNSDFAKKTFDFDDWDDE